MTLSDVLAARIGSRIGRPAAFIVELCLLGAGYFALAKGGLALASIHPSATPIWPPTGFALAVVLLRGYRVWPAIFLAALIANWTTAGTLATSAAIGAGNTLEGVIGGFLISRWSDGRDTYATPAGVARFSLLSFVPTAVSASVGVASLALAGFADWANAGSIWLTWWLGDLAGALVVTPVIVLWATSGWSALRNLAETAAVIAGAAAVGLIAFSPLVEQTAHTAPLGFLAVVPLLWSALRPRQRDTATVALVLSCFAVWGTLAGGGPFARENLDDSFLLLLMFMIATAVPSLVLSADVAVRKRTEEHLRSAQHDKQAERALRQSEERLAQAQKMEAIGQLTGGIAHDFNNILTHGGTFTLAARNVAGVPGRTAGPLAGDCVELALRDTGDGIAADVMPKIFDPFFTTKAVGKGTGLGLSQVYGFARQSGGAVTAKSDVGHGTTVTIWLPRSHAAKSPKPQAPGLGPDHAARARGTILVVEDNPEVAEVTATLLEQIGYRVLRAENAAGALATLRGGRTVDLVFSDIVMPGGMNGIHLAQEVSEHYPGLRVLLTTGYSDMAAAAETRYPILRKPFEVSGLERAVREALAGGTAARRAAQ